MSWQCHWYDVAELQDEVRSLKQELLGPPFLALARLSTKEDTAMRNLKFMIAAVLACAASPALSQTPHGAQQNMPSHYSLDIDDDFLLVDNSSCQIASAIQTLSARQRARRPVERSAEAVPRHRLDKEIDRVRGVASLQDEVASLKQEVLRGVANLQDEVGSLRQELRGVASLQDEVASLKQEVSKLRGLASVQDELASLKQEVAMLRETLSTTHKSTYTPVLVEALARTRETFKYAWGRVVEMIVNFQKDMKSLIS
jgi:DNA repair exonuclease SbcCD ATPase subunit